MRGAVIRLQILVFLVFLNLSCLTVIKGILLKLVTFSSHCRLVCLDTRASDDDTVDWNVHAGLDLQDITHLNVVVVDLLFFSSSDCHNLKNRTIKKGEVVLTMLSFSPSSCNLRNCFSFCQSL